jgi:hypothetical protein
MRTPSRQVRAFKKRLQARLQQLIVTRRMDLQLGTPAMLARCVAKSSLAASSFLFSPQSHLQAFASFTATNAALEAGFCFI